MATLTWMCVPAPVGPNIHAYGVIEATFAATLESTWALWLALNPGFASGSEGATKKLLLNSLLLAGA